MLNTLQYCYSITIGLRDTSDKLYNENDITFEERDIRATGYCKLPRSTNSVSLLTRKRIKLFYIILTTNGNESYK